MSSQPPDAQTPDAPVPQAPADTSSVGTGPQAITTTVPGDGIVPTEAGAAPDRPARPPAPRRTWNWRKWRARFVVLLMVGAAVAGGEWLVDNRNAAISQFDLDTVTLTAQPIPVEPVETGQVISRYVRAGQRVRDGQMLGSMLVTRMTATGNRKRRIVLLTAPSDGIASTDPLPVGSTVQPGDPFIQLYDPSELTLDAAVKVTDLPRLSGGMVATLHADGVDHPIRAVVQRVVPQFTPPDSDPDPLTDPDRKGEAEEDRMQLVLVPLRPADVAGLVPGMRFTGTVDTSSRIPDGDTVLQLAR